MKRLIIFLAILILPVTASCIGWFGFSNTSIQQLDADSYRLRVEVQYGGENFFNPAGGGYTGYFNQFTLTLLGNAQYHQTFNSGRVTGAYNTPGDWGGGFVDGAPNEFNSLVFGYDFNLATPLVGPVDVNYAATFYGDAVFGVTESYNEDVIYSGTASVDSIPEPEPFILFSLGLIIVGGMLRYKRLGEDRNL